MLLQHPHLGGQQFATQTLRVRLLGIESFLVDDDRDPQVCVHLK